MKTCQRPKITIGSVGVVKSRRNTGSEIQILYFLIKTCQRPEITIGSVGPDRVSQASQFLFGKTRTMSQTRSIQKIKVTEAMYKRGVFQVRPIQQKKS